MSVKNRLRKLEARTKGASRLPVITSHVAPPGEPPLDRDDRGFPVLTPDEINAVAAGDAICFVLPEPPHKITYKPDGRGGIIAFAR